MCPQGYETLTLFKRRKLRFDTLFKAQKALHVGYIKVCSTVFIGSFFFILHIDNGCHCSLSVNLLNVISEMGWQHLKAW